MIETHDLTIKYGDFVAVDRLNLHVPKGACYGFIGPNGAGKTSTMRTLATLMLPTEGTLILNGHDVVREPHAVKRCFGYMPDFFGVYDQLTVAEYLEFFARVYDVDPVEIPGRIDDTLAKIRLEVNKEAYIDTLSRGMKQRLSLGRAFIHAPPVLILDEPASGLDPRARREFCQLVSQLQDEGATILISSHILLELADICDHAAIIEMGKLIVSGSIDDILKTVRTTRCTAIRLCGGLSEDAQAKLAKVKGLHSVSREEEALLVETDDTDEAVARVVALLVEQKAGIAEMRAVESNLEEIFDKVTEGKAR